MALRRSNCSSCERLLTLQPRERIKTGTSRSYHHIPHIGRRSQRDWLKGKRNIASHRIDSKCANRACPDTVRIGVGKEIEKFAGGVCCQITHPALPQYDAGNIWVEQGFEQG